MHLFPVRACQQLAGLLLLTSLAACGASSSDNGAPLSSSVSTSTTTTVIVATTTRPSGSQKNSSSVPRKTTTSVKQGTTSSTAPTCASASDQSSLVVYGASSMINVFTDIKSAYLRAHPCTTDIVFSYGSSGTLATQIVNGAPADIFVSASASTMTTVQSANLLKASAVTFARNTGEIMVYPKSTYVSRILTVQDLLNSRNSGIKVGLCVASAPCGSMANTILGYASTAYSDSSITRSNLTINGTETPSVEDLVTKIELGELDAGIVYHSDCRYSAQRSNTTCVEIPANVNSTNNYLAGQLTMKKVATDFMGYLSSTEFQQYAQSKYGFLAP